jgi:hypothetical protein
VCCVVVYEWIDHIEKRALAQFEKIAIGPIIYIGRYRPDPETFT